MLLAVRSGSLCVNDMFEVLLLDGFVKGLEVSSIQLSKCSEWISLEGLEVAKGTYAQLATSRQI